MKNYCTLKNFLCVIIFCLVICSPALAAQSTSEAFMSLPFGHTFERTQKRMSNSGAKVLTPRKESLTMEGMFENYPAMFVFGFHNKKKLKSKAVYLQSMGDAEKDKNFYEAFQKAYNTAYGMTKESPIPSATQKKIMLQNIWTPDRYTTITLIYNPEASKRFPGSAINNRFLQIVYKYDKWDN